MVKYKDIYVKMRARGGGGRGWGSCVNHSTSKIHEHGKITKYNNN